MNNIRSLRLVNIQYFYGKFGKMFFHREVRGKDLCQNLPEHGVYVNITQSYGALPWSGLRSRIYKHYLPEICSRCFNNVYLFSVLLFFTAIAIAFLVPTITTSFFPLVTPV